MTTAKTSATDGGWWFRTLRSPAFTFLASVLGMSIVVLGAYYVDLERWRGTIGLAQKEILDSVSDIHHTDAQLTSQLGGLIKLNAQVSTLIEAQNRTIDGLITRCDRHEQRDTGQDEFFQKSIDILRTEISAARDRLAQKIDLARARVDQLEDRFWSLNARQIEQISRQRMLEEQQQKAEEEARASDSAAESDEPDDSGNLNL